MRSPWGVFSLFLPPFVLCIIYWKPNSLGSCANNTEHANFWIFDETTVMCVVIFFLIFFGKIYTSYDCSGWYYLEVFFFLFVDICMILLGLLRGVLSFSFSYTCVCQRERARAYEGVRAREREREKDRVCRVSCACATIVAGTATIVAGTATIVTGTATMLRQQVSVSVSVSVPVPVLVPVHVRAACCVLHSVWVRCKTSV